MHTKESCEQNNINCTQFYGVIHPMPFAQMVRTGRYFSMVAGQTPSGVLTLHYTREWYMNLYLDDFPEFQVESGKRNQWSKNEGMCYIDCLFKSWNMLRHGIYTIPWQLPVDESIIKINGITCCFFLWELCHQHLTLLISTTCVSLWFTCLSQPF